MCTSHGTTENSGQFREKKTYKKTDKITCSCQLPFISCIMGLDQAGGHPDSSPFGFYGSHSEHALVLDVKTTGLSTAPFFFTVT